MTRKRKVWTPAEDRALRLLYYRTPTRELTGRFGCSDYQIYRRANRLRLRKSRKVIADEGRRAAQHPNIAAHRFPKGHVPANKGLRRPGWAPGRMKETQFKPGCKPQTWVPVGTVVTDTDGYLKRKVADGRRPARRNWEYLHVRKWRRYRGPIPAGHAVVFKNGDKRDIRLANLECINRQELMRRNSIHALPKPLADVCRLKGALQRQINRRQRREEQD